MFTYRNQTGFQGHRGLQAKMAGMGLIQRRSTVENNPRANPITMRFWPQQNTAGGGNRLFTGLIGDKSIKTAELLASGIDFWLIRATKVAHDIDRLDHIATGA
ncbi:Uncharacterised protein [Yersinia enterocolitica]|nr:Uncharacterised protein [Yersinia enterocolitica]